MWPIVTDGVAYGSLSVCHSSEPCKTAEQIEMPFGIRTQVGPRNHAVDGYPHPLWEGAILKEGRAAHCKV